jgi:hypothetical protein
LRKALDQRFQDMNGFLRVQLVAGMVYHVGQGGRRKRRIALDKRICYLMAILQIG